MNEQAKHTPGPWSVESDTRIEYGPILAGEGFCVATVSRDPREWKANARLIASAPDLLEVLAEIAKGECGISEAANLAQAAILQAEG